MSDWQSLGELIGALRNADRKGEAALAEIYRRGCTLAEPILHVWSSDPDFAALIGTPPKITVGVAVADESSTQIFAAWGPPCFADVPSGQDALEFEIGVRGAHLDIITSTDPKGNGAIARYLRRFGEGIQQVECRVTDVDRATQILREKFGVSPVYPEARPGAGGTRVNFFLVPTPEGGKVLIELYEMPR